MASLLSSRGLVAFGDKTGNDKLGSGVHTTSASQVSCPDGSNNNYRCPLYDAGCYAEGGFLGMPNGTTTKINKNAGLDRREGSDSSRYTPEDVAEDEAEVISQVVAKQQKMKADKWPLMRLHIVGDAVNNTCVKIIAKAVGAYPALIKSVGMTVQKVWCYTHAWRNVDRSSWGNHISILASCDNPEDVKRAWARGYAAAIVVPCFKSPQVYDSGLGFKILPCPNESKPPDPKTGKLMECKRCRLCLRDEWLNSQGFVIAFKVHHANRKVKAELQERLYPIFGRCGKDVEAMDEGEG